MQQQQHLDAEKDRTETRPQQRARLQTEEYVAESSVKLGEYKGILCDRDRGIRDGDEEVETRFSRC